MPRSRRSLLCLSTLILSITVGGWGCATGAELSPDEQGIGGAGGGGEAGSGGSDGGSDGGSAGKAGTGGAGGGAGGSPANCHVVVNELQTGSSSSPSDEFIELFNQCSETFDLTGSTLVYRSAGGSSDIGLFEWTDGSIPGKGYLLIVGSAYAGSVSDDGKITGSGMSASGGGVGLLDSSGGLIDSVGYGSSVNDFIEGSSPAPNPPSGLSVGRTPNGTDTGNNAADFAELAAPSPRASN